MLTSVVGINWGDEGKGRMVDLLAEKSDIVMRYQGGNNAGHTVINERGKFILNLLPSGILRPEVVNVMGNGMVIDIEHLVGEIGRLRDGGIDISPANLKISDKAIICLPYHVAQDILEEMRLADKKYGSTNRGISPVYGDKYMKKGIRMGDLFEDAETFYSHVKDIYDFKMLIIEKVYEEQYAVMKKIAASDSQEAKDVKIRNIVNNLESIDALIAWLKRYGDVLKPYICDVGEYLEGAIKEDKNIMFEAQLGALRDIDFGIYPYTSSSSTIAGYAPVGAGIPGKKLDYTLGIMKAYSSCVGEGPFTCGKALTDEETNKLREKGGEYGAATGRPRDVGPFDVVASKYGIRCQGADAIALTKLDILECWDKIPVCVAYEVDGERTTSFPTGAKLNRAKPIVEYLDGWSCDISACRTWDDLPENAKKYIKYIEEATECKIQYVSVGAERDAYVQLF